jgi:hypothetical protein
VIVLHRRGTTGEWQSADLLADQLTSVLLKDGEFAIEEREDGSRHVKIGDGHTKFYALPYIDERAEKALLAKLQAAETALNNKIAKTSAQIPVLSNEVKTDLSELNNKINKATEDLTEALESSIVSLDAKLTKDISDKVVVLNTNINATDLALKNLATYVEADIKPSINSLDKKNIILKRDNIYTLGKINID